MPPQAVDQQTSTAIETVPPAPAAPVLTGSAALSDSAHHAGTADATDPALIDTAIRPAIRFSPDTFAPQASSVTPQAAPAGPKASPALPTMPGLARIAALADQGLSAELVIAVSILVAVLLTGIGVVAHLAAAVVVGVVIGVSAAFVLASRGMGEGKAR